MNPSSHDRVCQGRELHTTEWGAQHSEVVIAWHGLARTGRDMDDIAAHLASRYRVICPDALARWAAMSSMSRPVRARPCQASTTSLCCAPHSV